MLAVLLGSALKFEGRFILQTQTDGPVRMLVVDFTTPGQVRACARFDAGRVAAAIAAGKATAGQLLGHGHLAMTIDQGADMSRYQGLVALEGGTLEDAAHEYFLRSEQIPTRVRLAVAEELPRRGRRAAPSLARRRHPAAVPAARRRSACACADLDPGDAPEGTAPDIVPEDDAWVEGRSLIETVEDLELIDPALSSERLLYPAVPRARRARVRSAPVRAQCSCSRDSVAAMLRSFSQDDRDHMVENGVDLGDLRVLQRDLRVRARPRSRKAVRRRLPRHDPARRGHALLFARPCLS